jgi:hypothetical protein
MESKLEKSISDLLPDQDDTVNFEYTSSRDKAVADAAIKVQKRQTAQELARVKALAKAAQKRAEEREAQLKAEDLEDIPGSTLNIKRKNKDAQEAAKKVEAIELLEEANARTEALINPNSNSRGLPLTSAQRAAQEMATSRPEILKLMASLNMNLSLQLSKTDTANILACLLTCNEQQLKALAANKKVPLVIKTVIKRLQDDLRLGNIETIEKLWDRIFGKGPMQLDLPLQQQQMTGIIPNVPVSREAYIIMRDVLIK